MFPYIQQLLQGVSETQYLKGVCKKEGDRLISRVCCDRARGTGFKQKERFRLDIRKKVITIKEVRHWHRSTLEKVDAPSLEISKVRL